MRGRLFIVDAPSGTGKTPYLKACLRSHEQTGAKVVYSSAGDFESMCFALWRRFAFDQEKMDELTVEDVLGCADVFAIDDVDVVLHGKMATQRIVADMMARSLLDGKTIYIAGIALRERIPFFLSRLNERCPRIQEWLSGSVLPQDK